MFQSIGFDKLKTCLDVFVTRVCVATAVQMTVHSSFASAVHCNIFVYLQRFLLSGIFIFFYQVILVSAYRA